MDADGWAAIAGWASAVVALLGTAVAVWQARIARRAACAADRSLTAALSQARSARDSADSARKSAQAAITQAIAATQQVELMREQRDAERVRRDREDEPEFELDAWPNGTVGTLDQDAEGEHQFIPLARNHGAAVPDWRRLHTVKLTLCGGRTTYQVEVSAAASSPFSVHVVDGGPFRMIVGAIKEFKLVTPYDASGHSADLVIASTELDGPRRGWKSAIALRLP